MASEWSDTCDAILADLLVEVPGLRDALPHRYSPYDPEEQTAENGDRHIAVYPVAAAAQTAEPFVTAPGADQLTETYRVVYWEGAGDESARGVSDEEAAGSLLELAQAVRDRFYIVANIFAPTAFGDATTIRYLGTAFPDRSGQVRWFAVGVEATRMIQAT